MEDVVYVNLKGKNNHIYKHRYNLRLLESMCEVELLKGQVATYFHNLEMY